MNKAHVSFIILHYISTDITKDCVESILENIEYDNLSIIIVDNASPNGSGKELQALYHGNDKICVLLNRYNQGFAKGNNLGYTYAIEKKKADFIVITNNDTFFMQKNFIQIMQRCYMEQKTALIGPDIVTPEGLHQNPYREHVITYKEAKRWYYKRCLWTAALKMERILKTGRLQMLYDQQGKKSKQGKDYTCSRKDVVLQGACIIFTPKHIEAMDYAFFPDTFMYCEEDILTYITIKREAHTYYEPALRVLHKDGISTQKSVGAGSIEKNIFMSSYIVKSLKILLGIMRNEKRWIKPEI